MPKTEYRSTKFEVRKLSTRQIEGLSFNSWKTSPGQFMGEITSQLLSRHFVGYPGKQHDVFGLFPADSDRAVGVVVTEPDDSRDRALIRHAATDHRYLTEVQAIQAVARSNRKKWGAWRVDALESSKVAAELIRTGFLEAPTFLTTNESVSLMAYWRPDHELVAEFMKPANWSLFQGFNDV